MKLSRRDLAITAAVTLATKAAAQTAPVALTAAAQAAAAKDANQRASETLAKFEIPISTEPAFRFQA